MNRELLAALLTNPAMAQQQLRDMLAERAASDERAAAVLQWIENDADRTEPDGSAPLAQPTSTAPTRAATIASVRARVREMREDLIILSNRNRRLSAALGACAICWGEDEECEECKGQGGPGWAVPDEKEFRDLIAPAVARAAQSSESTPKRRTQE